MPRGECKLVPCQKPDREGRQLARRVCHRFTQINADQNSLLICVNPCSSVADWSRKLPSLTVGLLTHTERYSNFTENELGNAGFFHGHVVSPEELATDSHR